MKKKSLSKILALGMTAAMTVGMLAGCGNDNAESKPLESGSSEASGGGGG
ncbi:MAG: hypothetical protein HFH93_05100 [Lachnospiraceae bacterium]|nr:hypothetical protein [Lachnospiraceae bacterium]